MINTILKTSTEVKKTKTKQHTHTHKTNPKPTNFLVMTFIKTMKIIRTFLKSEDFLEKSIEENVVTLSLFQRAVVSK